MRLLTGDKTPARGPTILGGGGGSVMNGDARGRFASPIRANLRVFPALRDLAGDRKQHNANREQY